MQWRDGFKKRCKNNIPFPFFQICGAGNDVLFTFVKYSFPFLSNISCWQSLYFALLSSDLSWSTHSQGKFSKAIFHQRKASLSTNIHRNTHFGSIVIWPGANCVIPLQEKLLHPPNSPLKMYTFWFDSNMTGACVIPSQEKLLYASPTSILKKYTLWLDSNMTKPSLCYSFIIQNSDFSLRLEEIHILVGIVIWPGVVLFS